MRTFLVETVQLLKTTWKKHVAVEFHIHAAENRKRKYLRKTVMVKNLLLKLSLSGDLFFTDNVVGDW